MQRRVCCYRWLVQARSPEFHRDKSLTVFSWDVVRWGGGGGLFWGFREGLCDVSSGLSQPGGKSCWAVWRSGLWYSGTVYLRVGAGRDCGRDGWGPPRYVCPVDDEICKAFVIWRWGTLFLKYSTNIICTLSQIEKPLPIFTSEYSAFLRHPFYS